jgi:phosphonate transport system substrate-binding protein
MKHQVGLVCLIAVTLTTGCDQPSEGHSSKADREHNISSLDNRALIRLAFMTRSNPMLAMKTYRPLMNHLIANTPYRFSVVFNTESERTVGILEERLVEISHLGVVSYLEAHRQFGAVPLVKPLNRDGEPISRSVFITHQDSALRDIVDLSGRSLVLGAFHSTLSNLVPRHELVRARVRLKDLETLEHLDTDEEVASAVLAGRFDAGAVADVVADRYREEGLRVFHVSQPIPTAPLAIRDDLPSWVAQAIRDAFLRLDIAGAENRQDWDEEIRYGFTSATDADYEPVRQIMKTFPTRCEKACHGSP